ncbi:uncharacterized protein MYCFIDRAFT_176974 [Pseudocercospora fijiensis CIRAD86]|uniref:Uncharacterized protein n=1 Tax=Pseudocercospora fijiensis (strain CIRAD86) TaxID=383855 RepID=M3ARA8_PSEFD|nr:uncharacterized protein MYCFIDRAFT_176974 [Pseudocercospora fijiensis CIRAD86]EME79972.1 hypothetical protein MYCFIDRAFT_176974 [Pseudocercospora fijiensis CIRAD86]
MVTNHSKSHDSYIKQSTRLLETKKVVPSSFAGVSLHDSICRFHNLILAASDFKSHEPALYRGRTPRASAFEQLSPTLSYQHRLTQLHDVNGAERTTGAPLRRSWSPRRHSFLDIGVTTTWHKLPTKQAILEPSTCAGLLPIAPTVICTIAMRKSHTFARTSTTSLGHRTDSTPPVLWFLLKLSAKANTRVNTTFIQRDEARKGDPCYLKHRLVGQEYSRRGLGMNRSSQQRRTSALFLPSALDTIRLNPNRSTTPTPGTIQSPDPSNLSSTLMSSYGFSWCSCPHCGDANTQSYGLMYGSSVPYYDSGHQHSICQWCYLWQNFAPGYVSISISIYIQEMSNLYRQHGDTFEQIHDFFRGQPASRAYIRRLIRAIGKVIDGVNDMRYRSQRLKELCAYLYDLAEQVDGGVVYDPRYYARLPRSGGLYRLDRRITY